MGYGLIGLLILVLDIIAILDIIKSALTPTMKIVWVLLVLVLPVIGMILWFILGSKKTV